MNRFIRRMLSLGTGCLPWLIPAVSSQAQPLPARSATPMPLTSPFNTAELDSLTRQLAQRVQKLSDQVSEEMGNTPTGPTLVQDARELTQAIEDFQLLMPTVNDPLRGRQLFAGIDSSWHYLLAQLGRPGAPSPRIEAMTRQVGEIDAQIHKVLGSNAYPAFSPAGQASPSGMSELQRLAHTLVDRSEAMLLAVRADMRGPIGARLVEEMTSLVQMTDAYHDGIQLDGRADDLMRNGFAGVTVTSDQVDADLDGIKGRVPISPRVRRAWQAFRTTETLMRRALKLPVDRARLRDSVVTEDGRNSIQELANRLVTQTDEFLVAFTPEAKNVREGGAFIADARRLRAAAANFRDRIPRAFEVDQLAGVFRDVDALWQVLARRANRIAPGQNGPEIQRLEGIWQTIFQVRQMLGMPGFLTPVGPMAQQP